MSEEKKLNGTVIVTYRCNARCSMCNRYKAPSKPEEEISIETIRIPQQIRKQLLVQLDAIGFHESSIYPDMEHIAREEANMYFNSQN